MLAILAASLFLQVGTHSALPVEKAFSAQYSFDALQRLRAIRHEDGSTSWTTRDLGGRAVAQTTTNLAGKAQAIELFQNDGAHRIGTNGAGSARRFVYGRSLDEMLFQESGAAQSSAITSLHGSTEKVVVAGGAITQQYKYDAFGAPIAGDAKVFSQLFAGAHYDNKAKLYDLRNRHYDPRIGRFLSRDPLGMHADEPNLGNAYAYVGNNPLNRRDPLGLMGNPWWQDTLQMAGGTFAMVGGTITAVASGIAAPFTAGASTPGIIGGGLLAGYGADQFQAGFRSMWTGEDVKTGIETAVELGCEKVLDMTPENASIAATSADAAVGVVLSLGLNTPASGAKMAVAITNMGGSAVASAPATVNAILETGKAAKTFAGAVELTRALNGPLNMTSSGSDEEGPDAAAEDCPEYREKLAQHNEFLKRVDAVDDNFDKMSELRSRASELSNRIARLAGYRSSTHPPELDKLTERLRKVDSKFREFEFQWSDRDYSSHSSWESGPGEVPKIMIDSEYKNMLNLQRVTNRNIRATLNRIEKDLNKLTGGNISGSESVPW